MKDILTAPFLVEMIRTTTNMYNHGWDERNGGNVSLMLEPEEVAQYNQTYATRMLVKPGITGPWQVSGRSNLSEEESEALDVTYVQNWSMLGDVVLLFRTVGAVLTHKGAY